MRVELPERMRGKPVYHGLPVLFTTLIEEGGRPNFRVTDLRRWQECVDKGLCGVCGEPLDKVMVFVGGDRSIANQLFFDPPMHAECAEYSRLVCPFINGGDYSTLPLPPEYTIILESSAERPKRFGFLRCHRYSMVTVPWNGEEAHPLFHAEGVIGIKWYECNAGKVEGEGKGCPHRSTPEGGHE